MRLISIILLLLFCAASASAAPTKPRPLCGNGLLTISPSLGSKAAGPILLPLYQEPGTGRFADIDSSDLPSLATVLKGNPSELLLAVTRKKGEWIKVIYDESGREGWLAMHHRWRYQPWDRYLEGREVRLLTGLKKEYYSLRSAPSSSAQTVETVIRQKGLRVIEVSDAWMLVIVDLSVSGWIRWQDDNGRFLISVE